MRLLAVEDEAHLANAMARGLRREGFAASAGRLADRRADPT